MTARPNAPERYYNYAYLDEQTKRMIRRAILKALAIPGYQAASTSRCRPACSTSCASWSATSTWR